MATYPEAQGFDLGSVLQAAQLGKMLNPEVMQQQALGNQLALQLQQLKLQEAQQQLNDALHPEQGALRKLNAQLQIKSLLGEDGYIPNPNPGQPILAPLNNQQQAVQDTTSLASKLAGFTFDPVQQRVSATPIGNLPYARSLDARIKQAQEESMINEILKPNDFDLSQGQTRNRYNPITGESRQIAANAPKGERQVPLHQADLGNEFVFTDPFTGKEVIRYSKESGAQYKNSPAGLVKITKDASGKEKEEVLPGTGPIKAQTQIKLNDADNSIVDSLSKENAKKISIMNQLVAGVETFKDPSIPNEIKVVEGARLGKILNSTEGKDALQEAERNALLPFLEFNIGNPRGLFDPTKKVFGRNLPAFEKQLDAAVNSVNRSIDFNNKYIDKTYQKYGQRYTPESALDVSRGTQKQITPDIAKDFMQKAGNDREKAKQLARQAGYQF